MKRAPHSAAASAAPAQSSIITPHPPPSDHDKGERKFLPKPRLGSCSWSRTSQARRGRRLLLLSHPTRVQTYTRSASLTHVYALPVPCHLNPQWPGPSHTQRPQTDTHTHITPHGIAHIHIHAEKQAARPPTQTETGTQVQTCAPRPELADTVTGRDTVTGTEDDVWAHGHTRRAAHSGTVVHQGHTHGHRRCPSPLSLCPMCWH